MARPLIPALAEVCPARTLCPPAWSPPHLTKDSEQCSQMQLPPPLPAPWPPVHSCYALEDQEDPCGQYLLLRCAPVLKGCKELSNQTENRSHSKSVSLLTWTTQAPDCLEDFSQLHPCFSVAQDQHSSQRPSLEYE